jgi:hypothetical protein
MRNSKGKPDVKTFSKRNIESQGEGHIEQFNLTHLSLHKQFEDYEWKWSLIKPLNRSATTMRKLGYKSLYEALTSMTPHTRAA